MKKLFQIIRVFILFFILLSISGCEKDLYEDKLEQNSIKQVKLSDFPFLQNSIASKKIRQKLTGRDIDYLSLINTENIKLIEDNEGGKSFTFTLNLEEDNKLTNLVIKQYGEDLYYKLIEYSSQNFEQWKSDIKELGKSDIVPTVNVKDLDSRVIFPCFSLVYCCPSSYHHSDGANCDIPVSEWILSIEVDIDCFNGNGGESENNSNGDTPTSTTSENSNNNQSGTNSGGIHGGIYGDSDPNTGSTSTNNSSNNESYTVLTAPAFNGIHEIQQVYSQLTSLLTFPLTLEQINYLQLMPQLSFDQQLIDFISNSSDDPNDVQIFVQQLIEQVTLNPTLKFDVNASSKSPFFVDLNSVKGSTPEEIKFREVYDDLMTSSNFRHLFSNLFSQSPLINAKFQVRDIPQTGSGHTGGNCNLSYFVNQISSLCTITIDRTTLLTKSKAEIALVILHECIHAYLDVKFRMPSIGMSLEQINNMNFQQCINLNYNGFSGGQDQHSFMVDFLIPTMTQILKDIQNLIISPAQKSEFENPTGGGSFLYQPLTNNPPTTEISETTIPWNWDTFYTYFCYTGLQNCSAYPFNAAPNFLTTDDFYNYEFILVFNYIMQLY